MKKIYLIAVVAVSIVFATEVNSGIKIITDVNIGLEVPAPEEAIIVMKSGEDMVGFRYKMKNLFGGFAHHDYGLVNGMHVKIRGKSFKKIKKMLLSVPILKNSIESIEPNIAFKPMEGSNDTYYSKLWAMENSAQSIKNKNGTIDADMDIKEAWGIEKGSNDVVVAVLDTGVDYTHVDLLENMWSGSRTHGVDFAADNDGNNDDDPMPDEPYDENGHYHGTHVAGIIGAVGNNEKGISGVAQNIQIMAVKVFRPNGYAYSSDILEALDYISDRVDEGVNIVAINASYGGEGRSGDSIEKAIKSLGTRGVVFCAAAGNDGKDIDVDPVYPASYSAENIITVAASDQDDKLASFSNYGAENVDVVAPGTNILSTYPGDRYAYFQGTSMATPNVAGVVALLSSVDPDSTVKERIDAIKNGVDAKSNLNGKIGTDGRVNAFTSVKILDGSSDNHAPIAHKDNVTVDYGLKVTIDVLGNDSDVDGDTLVIKSVTKPSHGNVEIRDGKIEYMPDSGFSGDDEFGYVVTDGNGADDSAKATVTVKEKSSTAPVAEDDSAVTDEDIAILIDVLANDKDANGGNLIISGLGKSKNGIAKIYNGKVWYKANTNYFGNDSFSYQIEDSNGAKAVAKVEIVIKAVNDAPVAKDDIIKTRENVRVVIDALGNDMDIDNDSLKIKSIALPKHGDVVIKNGKLEYTPYEDFSGKDSFLYKVSDGRLDAEAGVEIEVEKNSSSEEPTAKVNLIARIFKKFVDAGKLISRGDGLYDFDDGRGSIKLERNRAKFTHDQLLMPKDTLLLEDFSIDGSRFDLVFKMQSNIRF